MLVLVMVVVVTMTEFVSCAVAATLDGVHEMVLTEQRQGTKHVRLVYRHDPALQLCQ